MGTDVLQDVLVCPAQEGHSMEFFAYCPVCPHVQRMVTHVEPSLPTHNAISTFFSFTALSTKTSAALLPAPFGHTQVPQLGLPSAPA